MANSRNVGNLLVQMRAELGGLKLDIKEMQSAFKGGFDGITNSAVAAGKSIAGALGVGFSITAIVAFGKSVIATAGQLQDLSDQTGISAQLLSGMSSIFKETGTSAEAFAKGIFAAQKNLGQIKSDTDPAAIAVKALKLNLDELRNATPDRFLELIAEAIAKIDNPVQRAALGSQLLNKTFQQLIPVITQAAGRFAELKAQGMNAEDIKRLDEFGDSWTRLGNRLQILAAGPLASLISGFEKLFSLTDTARLQKQLADIAGEIKTVDSALASIKSGKGGIFGLFGIDEAAAVKRKEELSKTFADVRGQLNALQAPKPAGAQTPFVPLPGDKKSLSDAESFLNALEKQASQLKQNIVEQTRGADAARELGIQFEAAAVKAKLLSEGKAIPKGFDQAVADLIVQVSALSQELREAKFEAEALAAAGKRDSQDSAEWLTFEQDVYGVRAALEKLVTEWDKMRVAQVGAMFDQDSAEFFDAPLGVALEMQRIANKLGPLWNDLAGSIRGAFDQTLSGILQGTQTWGEAMKNLMGNIGLSIANELQKAFIVNPLLKLLLGDKDSSGNLSGGLIQTGVSAIGTFFKNLKFFDTGGIVPGPIGAPQFAMVHGGETILPTHKTGGFGSSQVVYNIDARGAQRGVSIEVRRAIAMSHVAAVKESVGAVKNERQRSNNFARTFRG